MPLKSPERSGASPFPLRLALLALLAGGAAACGPGTQPPDDDTDGGIADDDGGDDDSGTPPDPFDCADPLGEYLAVRKIRPGDSPFELTLGDGTVLRVPEDPVEEDGCLQISPALIEGIRLEGSQRVVSQTGWRSVLVRIRDGMAAALRENKRFGGLLGGKRVKPYHQGTEGSGFSPLSPRFTDRGTELEGVGLGTVAAGDSDPAVSSMTPEKEGGRVTVRVKASDEDSETLALLEVTLLLTDGTEVPMGSRTDTEAVFQTNLPSGAHTLTARVTDTQGNTVTREVTVEVDLCGTVTCPLGQLCSPPTGECVEDTDPCTPPPCQNGGVCNEDGSCSCGEGSEGPTCSEAVPPPPLNAPALFLPDGTEATEDATLTVNGSTPSVPVTVTLPASELSSVATVWVVEEGSAPRPLTYTPGTREVTFDVPANGACSFYWQDSRGRPSPLSPTVRVAVDSTAPETLTPDVTGLVPVPYGTETYETGGTVSPDTDRVFARDLTTGDTIPFRYTPGETRYTGTLPADGRPRVTVAVDRAGNERTSPSIEVLPLPGTPTLEAGDLTATTPDGAQTFPMTLEGGTLRVEIPENVTELLLPAAFTENTTHIVVLKDGEPFDSFAVADLTRTPEGRLLVPLTPGDGEAALGAGAYELSGTNRAGEGPGTGVNVETVGMPEIGEITTTFQDGTPMTPEDGLTSGERHYYSIPVTNGERYTVTVTANDPDPQWWSTVEFETDEDRNGIVGEDGVIHFVIVGGSGGLENTITVDIVNAVGQHFVHTEPRTVY